MTGPLDFFTTSRSGESLEPILGSAASFSACWARASGVQALPVITAAAPMTALRMRNDRRSTPAGTSASATAAGSCGLSAGFDVGFIVFLCFWDANAVVGELVLLTFGFGFQ